MMEGDNNLARKTTAFKKECVDYKASLYPARKSWQAMVELCHSEREIGKLSSPNNCKDSKSDRGPFCSWCDLIMTVNADKLTTRDTFGIS
jgi:hypothetical protein